MNIKKRGQVWIETVLYTLIALALIGGVLAFVTPRITDAKDRAVIEQTISTLNFLDERINSALVAPGNRRVFDLTLRRGDMIIDSTGDTITIQINDLRTPYSQPGVEIKDGRVKILTIQNQKTSSVLLSLNYTGYANIQYNGVPDGVKKFNSAGTAYGFSIENEGLNPELGAVTIDIKETSGN